MLWLGLIRDTLHSLALGLDYVQIDRYDGGCGGAIAYARYDKRPPAVILSGTKCSVRISGGEKRLPRYARNDKRGEEIAALRSQ